MKRFISMLLALLMALAMFGCADTARTDETTACPTETTVSALLIDTCLLVDHRFEYVGDLPIEDIEVVIGELEAYIALLEETKAGLPTDHADYEQAAFMIDEALNELEEIIHCYHVDLEELLEEARWAQRMEEYPVATAVWLHLTENMEYNDYVAAGIIGNMMAECGDQTLKLKWNHYNKTRHYGLCQWSKKYYPKMQGATLEEQLAFMSESFPVDMNTYGKKYKKGFKHEDFMNLTDEREAAEAFMKAYERPSGRDLGQRKKNATKALEYFTN